MGLVETVVRVAAAVLFAASVAAQAPPDFSGRWILAPGPTASTQSGGRGAPGTMGSGWGVDITVTQDATTLTIEYPQFARGDMQPPTKFVYLLDGSESRNIINMGRGPQEQVSKTVWDGSKLVITTVHTFTSPQSGGTMTSETKRVLSLDSPASLVVDTTRGAVLGGPASMTKTIYKKN